MFRCASQSAHKKVLHNTIDLPHSHLSIRGRITTETFGVACNARSSSESAREEEEDNQKI